MKKILTNRFVQITAAAIAVIIIIFFLVVKLKSKHEPIQVSAEYAEFVSAVTSGVISSESTIKVVLVNAYSGDSSEREKILDGLFTFSPGIDGRVRWKDAFTLEFIPSVKLKQGTFYEATFNLSRVAKVPSKLSDLKFSFQTITQDFSISYEQLHTYGSDPHYYYLKGSITTADVEDNQKTEKVLQAGVSDKKISINWQHNPDRINHDFVIDSIKRTDDPQELLIQWIDTQEHINSRQSGNKNTGII